MNTDPTEWVKATRSNANGSCVEMRRADGGQVEVRDTKDRQGPTLTFTPDEFAAWLDGAKKNEFDHLI